LKRRPYPSPTPDPGFPCLIAGFPETQKANGVMSLATTTKKMGWWGRRNRRENEKTSKLQRRKQQNSQWQRK
jgi:hypothetical protein